MTGRVIFVKRIMTLQARGRLRLVLGLGTFGTDF